MTFTRPVLARAAGASALGGVAIGLGGAPYEAFAVAWLGPAAIVLALRAIAEGGDRHGLRRAALVGLAAGLGSNTTTCAWVVDLLTTYAYMPSLIAWLIASLLFLAQSLPFVIAAVLAFALHRMARDLVGAARPTIEVVHPISTVIAASAAPMIFPWRIGNSQTGFLALAQIAELGGLPLLDLVLGVASTLALGAIVIARAPRARAGLALAACACLGVPSAWGAQRLDEVRALRDASPSITVGMVQHDFDIPERMDVAQWESQLAITWSMTHGLDTQGVDLLLWPESSYPWGLDRERLGLGSDPEAYPFEMGVREQRLGAPIVLGAMTRGADGVFNSVIAIDGARVLGVVDKTRLMPFSERIPAWEWLPFLHPFLGPGMTPGPREGGAIDVAGARLGILNCYEDLMADHVWHVMQHDPTVLSNHTNDAWFGDTRAPGLHHFLARMRAIETRRDLVRTVNTGVSGVISASGERLVETPVFERTSLRVRVHPSATRTAWVRWGDLTGAAAWGVVLALLVRWLRSRVFAVRDARTS